MLYCSQRNEIIDLISSDDNDQIPSLIQDSQIDNSQSFINRKIREISVKEKKEDATIRAPKHKPESYQEVCTVVNENLCSDIPFLLDSIKQSYKKVSDDQTDTQSFPCTVSTKLAGLGDVYWFRRSWCLGKLSFKNDQVYLFDVFTEFPVKCPYIMYIRKAQDIFKSIDDSLDMDNVLKKIVRDTCIEFEKQPMIFLVLTDIKEFISKRRHSLNIKFRNQLENELLIEGENSSISTKDKFWSEWEGNLYRLAAHYHIHLMTRLSYTESDKDNLPLLIAEISKCIAWAPYSHISHAGLVLAMSTVGKKVAEDKQLVWKRWLEEVPRLSVQMAAIVAEKWPSYSIFYRAMISMTESEAKLQLSNLKPINTTRSLGQVMASRIYDHFVKK